MTRWINKALAAMAAHLKQPMSAFCDLDTADDDALVSNVGDYQSYMRLNGMGGMLTSQQIVAGAAVLREGIASSLTKPGHTIQACFVYDPDRSRAVVARQVQASRNVARAIGLDLDELFDEREQVWADRMAWEETTFALWTHQAVVTREARREEIREQCDAIDGAPKLNNCQAIWNRGGVLAQEHRGFVRSVIGSLRGLGVHVTEMSPGEAVASMREAVYPDTANPDWRPHLPGSHTMPGIADDASRKRRWYERSEDASPLLWEPLSEQIFYDDARVLNARHVRIGNRDWAGIDMRAGPETPRSFVELLRTLRHSRTPFRISFLIQGTNSDVMVTKRIASVFLGAISPANRRIFQALEGLRDMDWDSAVRLRVSLATWAPAGDSSTLRARAASLRSAIEGWGVCRAAVLAGDPLEAVMSSAPGLAVGSTAPMHAAPLKDALVMLPWNRPGSPWQHGGLLFATAEGVPFPVDPTGSLRQSMFSLIFGEPGHGKSVLSNTIILGLLLSGAALTASGAKLALVGLLDIGPSAEGLILLLKYALPLSRQHEAAYIRYTNDAEFSINPFDTQLGCRNPLPLEEAFIQDLLSLACTPIGTHVPFEGMDGLIAATIREVYRLASDQEDNAQPKAYNPDLLPEAAAALRRHRIEFAPRALWWDVVDALCDVREYRLAGLAQRFAVPVLADLIEAVRAAPVVHQFGNVKLPTGESVIEAFQRYVTVLVEWLPNLSRPTAFDTGEARVIVLDLEEVALAGNDKDDRQTEIMYLVGHHLLARNMFLRPGYVRWVPPRMRAYHRKRFTEVREGIKHLALDETHRANGAPRVLKMIMRARREGRKHRVHISMSSQLLRDFPPKLVALATEVFILGAGNEETNIEAAKVFGLSQAAAEVVRYRLKGPGRNGEGAPFLARFATSEGLVEQMLVNHLGPREVWALSTRPVDVALRNRLYEALGNAEAWRRLAAVFPGGTAQMEIDRRVAALTLGGTDQSNAEARVVESLAAELVTGTGLGLLLLRKAA